MTVVLQLSAIFAFGLVISGIVLVGILRAREHARRELAVTVRERPREPSRNLRLVA